MQTKSRTKVIFKDYSPNQILLLPPSLEEMIDPNHPVRIVNQVIESLDIDLLINKYKGGGCSSYHPRLLLKLLVYGYLSNQYSSRKIEQATKQNIHFMWLSAMSYPDHNTINRFRSDRLNGVLKEIFSQIKRLYQAQDCNGCPVREACNKSRGNRRIEINPRLNHYKSIIRERLTSERGRKYRSQRPVDVEAVFGIIKGNRNYRKFLLRGLEKVETEVGLLALSHNLSKIAVMN